MSDQLTHLDQSGAAHMVDVGAKPNSERVAVAAGEVAMQGETLRLIREGALKKGDVLTVARIAGLIAAKRTSELIPLCHPIALTHLDVALSLDEPNSLFSSSLRFPSRGPCEVTASIRTSQFFSVW